MNYYDIITITTSISIYGLSGLLENLMLVNAIKELTVES